MTNAATFATEFAKLAPAIAADYVAYVERLHAAMLAQHGSYSALRSLRSFNLGRYEYNRLAMVRRYLNSSALNGYTSPEPGMNREFLAKEAAQYADDQIASFVAKLSKKLGDLTHVEVKRANDSFECVVTGRMGEHAVSVVQNQKGVCNSHGTYFHQWPALIYVDGKRMTEAAFKALAAAA